jgi:hypothetical protein
MLKRYQVFVQIVPNVQAVQATSFLPRVAGEDEGGGLIVLNSLNELNGTRKGCLDNRTVNFLWGVDHLPDG